MASERKEKKRKAATSLPSDAPQKPLKKPKKSLENKEDLTPSVQAAEVVATDRSETTTKSKHKPRKRAADFLDDTEDNKVDEVSAPGILKKHSEITQKPKAKKTKGVPELGRADSGTQDVQPTANEDAELVESKNPKKETHRRKDRDTLPADVLLAKPSKDRHRAAFSDTTTEKVGSTLDKALPASSKKFKKQGGANGQASAKAQTLTADGINGVVEKVGNETLEPMTNKNATSTSMQMEGQVTTEKELEDEWGSDEEEDQGVALLAGFDSDGEDNDEDVGLEAGKPLPKLSKQTSKKVKQAAKNSTKQGPGAVYVGRIPHGFYEAQMQEYFSQFGTITKLRISRNKRTGASKHFAFIEFESDEVAKIVANTMDNYLMFGHILKCKYAPQERLHPDMWKGANKRFRKVPYTMLEKRALEAPKTAEQWEKKNEREQKKREQKAAKMKELGYEFKLPTLKGPREVLEQRKLQDKDQPKLLETAQVVADADGGTIGPLDGVSKDEVILKAEKKNNRKKNNPTQQQSMNPVRQATASTQPAEATIEKPNRESEKREKRKEKRAKSKDAKIQQTQLDDQLLGDIEAAVGEADTTPRPAKSTNNAAESLLGKSGSKTATTEHPTSGNEKKRKRRKGQGEAATETAMPVAKRSTQLDGSADKPKNKKRKSDNKAEA